LVAAAKFLVEAQKKSFVVLNFVAVTNPFFPCKKTPHARMQLGWFLGIRRNFYSCSSHFSDFYLDSLKIFAQQQKLLNVF